MQMKDTGNNVRTEIPAISYSPIYYNFPFKIIVILVLIGNLRIDRLLLGISSSLIIQQIPNVLTGLLFLYWLIHRRKIIHNPLTKLYFAFWLLMIVGTAFARNPTRALNEAKGFSIMFAGCLAMVSFVDSLPKLNLLLKLFLFCNVPIAFLGISSGGLIRQIPTLADENDFALLMNMLAPFAFFLCLKASRIRDRFIYFGMFLIFITGTVVSMSRGGFVGLVLILVYCLFKIPYKKLLLPIGLVIGLFFYLLVPHGYWEEMYTIKTEGFREGTGEARVYYWKNALKIFADHPIIGVGPNNAGVWITTYDPTERGARDWGRALHSIYFTLIAEHGIVGSLLFLGMIFYGERDKKRIAAAWKRKTLQLNHHNPEATEFKDFIVLRDAYFYSMALSGALIGYLSSGAFLSVLYYPWFWTISCYTVILTNAIEPILQGTKK